MPTQPVSVLFVCLGNICRSTMAEGIFQHLAKDPQYKGKIGEIDSCGTGKTEIPRDASPSDDLRANRIRYVGAYHTGEGPDDRTMSTLEDNGINDYEHAARKVSFS